MSPSPVESADKSARQRRLRGSLWFTVPGTYGCLGAAYALVPPLAGLAEPGERLVFAAHWLLVAFIPYAAVCLTILYERFAEGAHKATVVVVKEDRRYWAIHDRTALPFIESAPRHEFACKGGKVVSS